MRIILQVFFGSFPNQIIVNLNEMCVVSFKRDFTSMELRPQAYEVLRYSSGRL